MPIAFERERAEGEGLAANDEVISADNRRPVKCEHDNISEITLYSSLNFQNISIFLFLRYNNYG